MSSLKELSLVDVFRYMDIPLFYGSAQRGTPLPYLIYLGDGQRIAQADNTHYWKEDSFRIEYYFTEKNMLLENGIETALLGAGYLYEKSEDIYIEDEGVFLIYYSL